MSAAAVVFAVFYLTYLGLAGRSSTWQHTACTVVGSRIVRNDARLQYNTPVIMYKGEYQLRYMVNGQQYFTWANAGWSDKDRQFIEGKMLALPQQCPYDVQFNPHNPAEAVAHGR